jgi:hypothetical protein
MRPGLAVAVLALSSLAAVGAARAQACLSVNDGVGGVHITCPDGRSGYLNNLGAGVLGGLIGGQPYQTPATNLAPPLGLRRGTPGAGFVSPPLTAPQVPQTASPSYLPSAPGPYTPVTPPYTPTTPEPLWSHLP